MTALISVFFIIFTSQINGYMLTVNESNPCMALGNGTKFDISNIFKYPVGLSGAGTESPYNYWWSPCKPYNCPNSFPNNDDVAVCQKADQYYNCGSISNAIWLWNPISNTHSNSITILYPGGQMMSWRNVNVTLIQDNHAIKPIWEQVTEYPYLQYNIIVRAKCIGMTGWDEPVSCTNIE
mmetsp:Transcript_28042/g.34234  ORF Transcript_28042/g.34234 Transcript_28042/m.34234 type:complete len:180 (-) Transcript_28042:45-584(-)